MKEKILQELLQRVRAELAVASDAGATTKSYAQDGDVKSDGKYDTRGIEAGYLAGAQMKRVEELRLDLQMLEELPVKPLNETDEVELGALVDLGLNGECRRYFLATTAGGTLLNVEGQAILVITPFSPIGDAVLGARVGEEFELETPQGTRCYTVLRLS